jgi:hypothetical protein
MFSLKNGKVVKKNKFASQHIFGPSIALFKKRILCSSYNNRYIRLHQLLWQ